MRAIHAFFGLILLCSTCVAVAGAQQDAAVRDEAAGAETGAAAYGVYVLVAGLLLVVQSGLIAGLLFHRRRSMRVERQLRESEERFRLMADTAPVLIWRSGTDKRRDYFNRPWLEFTGRTLEQELGDGWAEGVWPEDLERCLQTYRSAVDQRRQFRMEYRLRGADGVHRWILDTGVPRFGPDHTFAGYIGSAIDITERRHAEEALRESEAAVRGSHREIQDLSGRLLQAQETERARIARDLHDDVGQQLAGLSVALTVVESRMGGGPDSAGIRNDLSLIQQRASTLGESVRNLSRDLHPEILRQAGLVPALRSYCSEIGRRHSIALTFDARGDARSIDPPNAVCLYRVAQETLGNVLKHSRATHVHVRLLCDQEHAEITIADDGRGFDLGEARAVSGGLGLVSMNERVRMTGGSVTIRTGQDQGTQVRVQVPLRTPAGLSPAEEPVRRERLA